MTAALNLDPAASLHTSLMPLIHQVRRDPRLAHATLSVGGEAEIDLSFTAAGLHLRVGPIAVGELPSTSAFRALSHLFQLYLADGWGDASIGAFARRVGPGPLQALLAGLR